jgi:hypothetical protein
LSAFGRFCPFLAAFFPRIQQRAAMASENWYETGTKLVRLDFEKMGT